MQHTPPFKLSERTRRLTPPPINWLIEYQLAHPEVISLAAGLVDYETLPGELIQTLSKEILNPQGMRKYLQYGTTQGLGELRSEICRLFNSQEIGSENNHDYYHPRPEDCVIGTGSQQLLMLIADSLFDPGDIVLIESPTYLVFMGVLEVQGVKCVHIPMDDQGIIPAELEKEISRLKSRGLLSKVKCLYTVDYYQNPSNISLADERKKKVYDIITNAESENPILIIEDAAYRDLAFENIPTWSIKSYDKDNQQVAYTSTFTKPFSPGLKTGYCFLPEILCKAVIQHKGNHDFGSAHYNQGLILQALTSGTYTLQVQTLRERYFEKAKIMYSALKSGLPDDIQFNMPEGGLYFWLTFPDAIHTGRDHNLFNSCLRNNVLYVPGEYCYAVNLLEEPSDSLGSHKMRLSYGTVELEEIEEGVERLAKAVKKTFSELKSELK